MLQPPQYYNLSLQKVFIGLKVLFTYLHKSYGGLGLVDILSILHAFKLRFIHEYLYSDSHSCFRVANAFLEELITFHKHCHREIFFQKITFLLHN